jgi:hypothetical protein
VKHIRLATREEVEALRATSNYTRDSIVFAMDNNAEPDFAVVKRIVEAEPFYFGKGTNDVQKARFGWALEERLMGMGVEQYFYSVDAADERWLRVQKSWGAQEVSPGAVIRLQKTLVEN